MLVKVQDIERDINVIGVQLRITNKKYRILYKVISEEAKLVNIEVGTVTGRSDKPEDEVVLFREFGIVNGYKNCPEGWSFQKVFDCRDIPIENIIPDGLEI